MKIHPVQEQLLKLLSKSQANPLTIRELQEELEISSTSVVAHHLKQLEKKGLLKRNPSNTKDYVVTTEEPNGARITYLNLFGLAQCGPKGSILEHDPIDKIAISSELVKFPIQEMFLVKAKGDSMQPKIQHGDIVFIRQTNVADNGDIVLCINDGEALIKQYAGNKGQVILSSINSEKYPSFIASDDFRIEGIVKGLFSYRF